MDCVTVKLLLQTNFDFCIDKYRTFFHHLWFVDWHHKNWPISYHVRHFGTISLLWQWHTFSNRIYSRATRSIFMLVNEIMLTSLNKFYFKYFGVA